MTDTLPVDADAVLDGLHVIDCDAHFTEPADTWSARVPDSLKDQVPQLREVGDGLSAWYLNGDHFLGIGGNTIRRSPNGPEKVLGRSITSYDEVDAAAYDAKARLALLDDLSVY